MKNDDPVTILLVEDDEIDVAAIRRALRALEIDNPIVRAADGIEALERLRGADGRERIAGPVLVLLDLNLPRMNGIELLEVLRNDPALTTTIVFVMSTSAAKEDRERAYAHHVAGYLLKDLSGRSLLEAMAMLRSYCGVVEFPDA